MREQDLPSPGSGAKGFVLRRVAAQAISAMQVSAPKYTTGQHPAAAALSAFFAACKSAADTLNLLNGLITLSGSGYVEGTGKTYSIASGATAGPAVNKNSSTGAVTYTSSVPGKATVNAATGAVTGVAAGTTTITLTMATDGTYRAATKSYVATITA